MGIPGGTAIASTLAWWAEAGVDTLIDEAPRNWLARATPAAAPVEAGPVAEALPDSLDAFIAWRMTSPDVPEAAWSPNRVAPFGDPASGAMILIDQPADTDMFEEAEGRLFDRMLAAIGRDRASVWCAPLSHARVMVPPTPEIRARLAELALHHIALATPRIVLAMGDAASRALTGLAVTEARGALCSVNHPGGTLPMLATHHPRLLLDRPAAKAGSWADLQLFQGGLSR